MILAIDPGNEESGVVLIREGDLKPLVAEKIDNEQLLYKICAGEYQDLSRAESINHVAIEMIASYGMAVGKSVFETCVFIGRLMETIHFANQLSKVQIKYIYRKDEKMNLCGSMKAKDSNIVQALIDRFAPNIPNKGKGSKKEQGWFYGFKADIWAAYAVGVTYHDMYLKVEE